MQLQCAIMIMNKRKSQQRVHRKRIADSCLNTVLRFLPLSMGTTSLGAESNIQFNIYLLHWKPRIDNL